jgi:hypothetical protein
MVPKPALREAALNSILHKDYSSYDGDYIRGRRVSGIFRKIRKLLGLLDERHAILELSKGESLR